MVAVRLTAYAGFVEERDRRLKLERRLQLAEDSLVKENYMRQHHADAVEEMVQRHADGAQQIERIEKEGR